jgi:hypothetical protein
MGAFVRLITPMVGLAILSSAALAGGPIRVVTWNVSNYSSGRVAYFQTAIYGEFEGRTMAPDIFIGQEFLSQTGVNNFVNLLNTASDSPGDWTAADFVDGRDTDSALFYRTDVAEMATDLSPNGVTVVATGGPDPLHPRNIMRYDVRFAAGTPAETTLAIYSSHMKAGSSSDDQARRRVEAERIRNDAETLPDDWHFLLGGDFNIQSSFQTAYQILVGSQADDRGRFHDPIDTPGNWNNNESFRIVHTQDPAAAMDDRHDQILVSIDLIDGAGLDYVGDPTTPYSATTWDDPNHSYRSWGNDGTSYDARLTITGNTMVGSTIAQALVSSAAGGGHLPVFLDLRVPPCRGDYTCDGIVDLTDFARFAECLSGPDGAAGFNPPTPVCLDFADFDDDGDVDLQDFAELE